MLSQQPNVIPTKEGSHKGKRKRMLNVEGAKLYVGIGLAVKAKSENIK
jgi:hypothetical protein